MSRYKFYTDRIVIATLMKMNKIVTSRSKILGAVSCSNVDLHTIGLVIDCMKKMNEVVKEHGEY